MKTLVQFINEALVSKHTSKIYNYHPQTMDELKKLVNKLAKGL